MAGKILPRSCQSRNLMMVRGSCRVRAQFHTRRQFSAAATAEVESPVVNFQQEPPAYSRQEATRSRRESVKNARPFSSFLTDTFQRQHDYLRISVTEKCNLRCLYCMPEEGVPQSPAPDLLTSPEIYMLSSLFVSQGVTKIRLTGGEPTVRKDIVPLMHQIGSLRSQGLKELCLTTNGLSLHRKLDSMVEAGLTGVNLSLDTLDPWQFQIMTRRKGFETVMKSINRILEMNEMGAGIKLKVNCVVMRGMNEREIVQFVEMGKEKDLEVRFIEYMPFDGNRWSKGKMLGYAEMLDMIKEKYPNLRKVKDHKNDTSKTYEIPGFVGKFGFITSMTHNFCGSCNRLRITSDGNLKVCLFGNAEVSLRDILRKANNSDPIDEQAFEAMQQIEMDRRQVSTSLSNPLGHSPTERELLQVIGLAVHGKKEKHAGIGELENMKNRPMILIDKTFDRMVRMSPTSMLKVLPSSRIGAALVPMHLLGSSSSALHVRHFSSRTRAASTLETSTDIEDRPAQTSPAKLTHLSSTGSVHMVEISEKESTARTAVAVCSIHFSDATALALVRENAMKKGDVLGVARIAGIMAAKQTANLIPLCHPISLTHVAVEVTPARGFVPKTKHSIDEPRTIPPGFEQNNKTRYSLQWAGTGQGDAYKWTKPDEAKTSHATSSLLNTQNQNANQNRIDIKATVTCQGKTGVEMEALTAASTAALTVYDMCKAVDKGMHIEGLRVVHKEGGKSGTWVEGKSV